MVNGILCFLFVGMKENNVLPKENNVEQSPQKDNLTRLRMKSMRRRPIKNVIRKARNNGKTYNFSYGGMDGCCW